MTYKKKTQSSLENLMIMGIGLTLILLLTGTFVSYSNSSKKTLDSQQINSFGEELITNIETIYFRGQGNRLTMKTSFPDNVKNISILHLNITNSSGHRNEFEIINLTLQNEGFDENLIFSSSEPYIRFNCTLNCIHVLSENISYFDQSFMSSGSKEIRIESKGDFVSVDFIN